MNFPNPTDLAEATKFVLDIQENSSEFFVKNWKELLHLMDETSHSGLRSLLAMKLTDAGVEEVLPVIIRLLISNLDKPYTDTLCYCCTKFECSDYWQLFSDIMLVKDNLSFYHAASVIANMEALSAETRFYIQQKIRAAMALGNINERQRRTIEKLVMHLNSPYLPS